MKVLVIDDHPVIRAGLSAVLCQLGSNTTVLQAGDAEQALGIAGQHPDLDIVVLDLMMPGLGGFPVIAEFGRIRPDLPVLVLSSSEDPQDARKAFAHGALGYVPKSAGQNTLLAAARLVLNGDLYVPPLILTEPPSTYLPRLSPNAGGAVLTDRQIDVLRRLGEGQSNRTIALELGLSEKTVKAHVTAIFRALNVVSRTQAAAAGREAGLI
jgi:two-component system, NarL family, nitrate/nitrite response regulator NarL